MVEALDFAAVWSRGQPRLNNLHAFHEILRISLSELCRSRCARRCQVLRTALLRWGEDRSDAAVFEDLEQVLDDALGQSEECRSMQPAVLLLSDVIYPGTDVGAVLLFVPCVSLQTFSFVYHVVRTQFSENRSEKSRNPIVASK